MGTGKKENKEKHKDASCLSSVMAITLIFVQRKGAIRNGKNPTYMICTIIQVLEKNWRNITARSNICENIFEMYQFEKTDRKR